MSADQGRADGGPAAAPQGKDADDKVRDLLASADTGARAPRNPIVGRVLVYAALLWSLFQLWYASPLPFIFNFFILNEAQARAIHLGFAVFLAFLAFPSTMRADRAVPPIMTALVALVPTVLLFLAVLGQGLEAGFSGAIQVRLAVVAAAGAALFVALFRPTRHTIPVPDWVAAVVAAFCASYQFWFYDALASRPGLPTSFDILVSLLGLVLLLEATRRSLGPPLMIVALVFMAYVFFGNAGWIPDVIMYQGASISRAMSHFWLGPEGVFGIAIGVSTKFVFLFVLFGALLEKAGAGNYFIQVAFSLLGHLRGGPAKAAVVASGMTGLISGSSIANVVTTGTFTIPLMRRVGFTAEKAGAVEVASSVNGQIMPPVMGAAAFLMVEYVGIPYIDVIKHAFLPAIISYIALVYIVHLEAVKTGMTTLPKPGERIPAKWQLIGFGITASSVLILAGAAYWVLTLAGKVGASPWIVGAVVVVLAAQVVLQRAIGSALPADSRKRLVSVGALIVVDAVLVGFGLVHAMALLKAGAGPATPWVVALCLLAVYVALAWYATRYPVLALDDPNAPIIKLPEVGPTVKSGLYFLLPIGVLVWCLMIERLSPALSAFWATAFMIFILLTQRQILAFFRGTHGYAAATAQGGEDFFDALVAGARNMIGIGIATATAGIVVGTVTLTGIGLVMAAFVEFLSGGNLILMLVLVAVLSLILGMGLPTTANYIVVSSLMAPVIVQLGAESGLIVPLIAVHLFVFYFGIMADVTPPVGLASFAAAAVSGGEPLRTGFTAFFYSLRTVALPFIFIFNTELILYDLQGFGHLFLTVSSAIIAMLVFAAATQGWFFARCKVHEIVILLLVAFTLFRPGFWMDMVVPPFETRDPTALVEIAEEAPPDATLRVTMRREDYVAGEQVINGVLRLGEPGPGEERLARAGVEFLEVRDGAMTGEAAFGGPLDNPDYDPLITFLEVRTPNDQPPKELMFIPALLVLGGVIALQLARERRRTRGGAGGPAVAGG
ncbi:MAG: TRAP transporter permease [Azospirillaceae bacterium]